MRTIQDKREEMNSPNSMYWVAWFSTEKDTEEYLGREREVERRMERERERERVREREIERERASAHGQANVNECK